MVRAVDDTKPIGFVSTFDPMSDSVTLRVVETVANFHGVDPTDLDPLYSAIDPDGLDALFAPTESDRGLEGEVTFQYENVTVSVNGDGTIRLSDLN